MTTLRVDGDSSGSVKAFLDLDKAVAKVDGSLELTARQAKKLELAAGQVVKANEGPIEKYNRRIAELAELVKRGVLSHDQANAAAERHRRTLERAVQSGEQAFGARMLGNLTQMATGYLSLQAAAGLVSRALQDIETQSQKSADAVFNSLASAGELQQLAENPEQFNALVEEGHSLVRRGIVKPGQESEAFQTIFNLQSAGFNAEEREALFRPARNKQISDIAGLGGKLRGAQDLFGADDTGNIAETLDKVLQISKATLEDAAQTAVQIPKFGSEAKAIGLDFETSGAAYVAARKQSASAETTADRLKSFFTQVDKRGLNKGELYETIAAIQSQIDSGKTASDVLGDANAVAGFRALNSERGRNIFSENLPLIQNAQGSVDRQNYIGNDPELLSAALRAQTEGQLADTLRKLDSERENLFESYKNARVDYQAKRFGGSGFSTALVSTSLGYSDLVGAEDQEFRNAVTYQREQLEGHSFDVGGGKTVSLLEAIEAHLARQTVVLESLDDKKTSRGAANTKTRPARP